ncbi:MAG TPA: hypothetical protein VFE46_14215 [Pirellulales bacterium]|jgi:hypothetical protein|nr:hypothetical protein [Pirellulales bacterium]
MSNQISCNLTANAVDYLLLAGEQAKDGTPRMVKHAMATLMDGLELLMKARLEAEDWKYVFADPSHATLQDYQSGDFFSVAFRDLVTRLKSECDFEIPKQHVPVLDLLRKLRNKIRHFSITIDHATAMAVIVKAYSFALDFIGTELEDHVDSDVGQQIQQLRTLLTEFDEFVKHREQEIQPEIDGNRFAVFINCPVCLQPTLYGDGGTATCLFCGRRGEAEDIASEVVEQNTTWMSPKDRLCSDPDVEECPECGATACLAAGRLLDFNVRYVCLNCGESGDYEHCTECGRLYSGESITDRCDDCHADLMDRND